MDVQEFKTYFQQRDLTFMVVKDDNIVFESEKSRLTPIIELIEDHSKENLAGSFVFDNVVGKAAALLISFIQAKWVFTTTLSRSAKKVLEVNNIPYEVELVVEKITPPGEKSHCPFEKAVADIMDPHTAYEVIKAKLKAL